MKNTVNNFTLEIIDKADYDLICSIAEKYNMSVINLGKLLSKKTDDNRPIVRFTAAELEIIDKRRKMFPMSMSEYCRRCFMKAIEDGSYMEIDIRAIKKDTYNKGEIVRDKRKAMSFNNAEDYKKMILLSEKLSLEFSSLIRYFALNIEL